MSRPRAVIDTNVLVSAFWKPASVPARVVDAWRKDKFVLCYSRAMRSEYRRTVTRVFGKGGALPPHIAAELALIVNEGELIKKPPRLRGSVPRDASDEKFMECAVAAQAVIVSGDDHLLERNGYRGVAVVKPADFARELNL